MTDPDELARHYCDSPAAHIYALVDLEEPFWSASQWYRRGQAVVGLVQIPGDPVKTLYAVSTRDPEATLSLIIDLLPHLGSGTLITGPLGLADAVEPRRSVAWSGPHLRYHLVDRAQKPVTGPRSLTPDAGGLRPVELGPAHADDIGALYATEPGAAFYRRSMLDDDSFVGVFDDGDLVAAAGTHVLSSVQGVAAIGAVYTRPSHRGQGLGRLVTAGVIQRLTDRVTTIGLNVAEANTPARHIYQQLGFEPILAYEELELA
ncbi:MAG: GNAT family N-acetyltransferase [Actinomycetia bacterium]|nr:GNAT family N-acetyltransferase [Actinomycetes bacterium]MCP4222896.1 GNAT family N-acetyltransferase [Actinomycetes bacterium]MCP5033928.1 GNAT family N-acetyltransferase [Actinomycetes bacterium]